MSKKIIFQKCHLNNIYFLCYIIMDFINQFILYKFYPSEDEIKTIQNNYIYLQQILLIFIYIIYLIFSNNSLFYKKKLLKEEKKN